jgi:hypothetical protein
MEKPVLFNFEKLEVYRDAVEFAGKIYELTKAFPKTEMFGISNHDLSPKN